MLQQCGQNDWKSLLRKKEYFSSKIDSPKKKILTGKKVKNSLMVNQSNEDNEDIILNNYHCVNE